MSDRVTPETDLSDYITKREVAELLGIPAKSLNYWRLPSGHVAGVRYFRRADVANYLEGRIQPAGQWRRLDR